MYGIRPGHYCISCTLSSLPLNEHGIWYLYLLADVPDAAVIVHFHEPVLDGHFVELSTFFVPKERVRDPHFFLRVDAQSDRV